MLRYSVFFGSVLLSFLIGVSAAFMWLNFELTKTKNALALANQMAQNSSNVEACGSVLALNPISAQGAKKHLAANKQDKALVSQAANLVKDNAGLIDFIPEKQLTEFMGYALKDDEIQGLDNPRQFAKRFAQELALDDSPVSESSQSRIVMSLSSDGTKPSITTFDISPSQKIYAHIHVGEGPGLGDEKLFVRWVNSDTGEVILFDRKSVKKNQPNNWVSLKPSDGWKSGNYQVTYYRFDSAMTKLATAFYTVQLK